MSTITKWSDININVEYAPLGIFWTDEWKAQDSELTASTSGRDRLELLRKSTYTSSQVQVNKTLYSITESVLQDAGLKTGEYWIDSDLQNYVVPYSYFNSMSHRDALRIIAEAALGQVYCDREGVIRVEGANYLSGAQSVLEITQDDYFTKDNPPKNKEVANYIEVETQPLRPDTQTEVYRSNDPIKINPGETQSISIYYNEPPCINAIASLEGATNTVITSAKYYAWGAALTLSNTGGVAENITTVMVAIPLKMKNKEKAVTQDATSIRENGTIKFTFPANPLVQTLSRAQQIANVLLQNYKNPRRDLTADWRGNPALTLGDRITLIDNNGPADYLISKQDFQYQGYLRAKMEAKKA